MRFSIALCTFNGSRFLREQLESIAAQTRLPDELIIVDDRSTDDTVEIARSFAATATFSVQIEVNSHNLGSTGNFEKAIGLCGGDIIALSDQDDVWNPRKLEEIAQVFRSDREIGLVFTNATLTDEELRPKGVELWRETFRPRDRSEFEKGRASTVLLQYNVVTGATMAFSAKLKPAILPIPVLPEFIHDAWIALIASLSSRVVALPRKSVLYRQHSAQQLGAGLSRWKISRSERYRLTIADRRTARIRLEDFERIIDDDFLARLRSVAQDPRKVPDHPAFAEMLIRARQSIDEHIAHISARAKLPRPRRSRLPEVLGEFNTGRYRRYSRGLQSAVLDLIRK